MSRRRWAGMSTPPTPTGSVTRVNTLSPPSTVTNGTHITRADYQRWAHEDRNHSTADMTRIEREERRKFRQEEKERWRQRGGQLREGCKQQVSTMAEKVQKHKEGNAEIGLSLREREAALRKTRSEQQKKWADHGYELTQTYTIKAAQNNMRSLKAQNAGIVNGMHAKRQDHETIVEAQRQQAQEERRQRVEKIRGETTDNVTRAAKKAFVDERWDIADSQRCERPALGSASDALTLGHSASAAAADASMPSRARDTRARARAAGVIVPRPPLPGAPPARDGPHAHVSFAAEAGARAMPTLSAARGCPLLFAAAQGAV